MDQATQPAITWTLIFAVAATTGIGIIAGLDTKNPHGDPTNNILVGIVLARVITGVLEVMTMAGEYTSGTIRTSLAAIPRRPLLLATKATVFGTAVLVAGEISTFAAFQAGVAFLRPGVPHPTLSHAALLQAVALSGAYLAPIGLIGLALGAIIRHSAAAIATLVGVLLVARSSAWFVSRANTYRRRSLPTPLTRSTTSPCLTSHTGSRSASSVSIALPPHHRGWLLDRRDASHIHLPHSHRADTRRGIKGCFIPRRS